MSELRIPDIGGDISTAFIARWHVAVGEHVATDQPVLEVDTDKATFDILSETAGVLSERLAEEGDEVLVGAVVARFREGPAIEAGEQGTDAGGVLSGPTIAAALSGRTAVTEPPSTVRHPQEIRDYRVLERVGEGGMGIVYRARHKEPAWARRQGDVAIKLIHPRLAGDRGFRDRFVSEALTLQGLNHPHVVGVIDVVTVPRLGILMPFIEGHGLETFVRPGGLPLDEALALLRPVAEALDHLHARGMVHRDVKPTNIRVGLDGKPVILDFGIAELTAEATPDGHGTVGWMAPEQLDGRPASPRSDLYAFAQVAYVLLGGTLPWPEGTSVPRILSNKLVGRLDPLLTHRPQLRALSDQLMRGLDAEPTRRPDSCRALLAGLPTDTENAGATACPACGTQLRQHPRWCSACGLHLAPSSEEHKEAYRLLASKDVEGALWRFRKLLDVDPADVDAHVGAARCEMGRREFRWANEHLRKATLLAPEDTAVLIATGDVLCAEGSWARAHRAFDLAVRQPGCPVGATFARGRCSEMLGDPAGAVRDYLETRDRDPDFPRIQACLGAAIDKASAADG